jgi:GNAT superfamily N-acetyltransferase
MAPSPRPGPPALAIRPAVPADAAALTALVESAYRGDFARRGWTHEADLLSDRRLSDGEMAAILADPARAVLVAELAAAAAVPATDQPAAPAEHAPAPAAPAPPPAPPTLAGCVALARRPAGQPAYLGMLTVRPDLQSARIGSRLMDAAEAHAATAWAAPAIELWVIDGRDELARWYLRRGYADTGARQPFPGRSDYWFRVLARPLAAAPAAGAAPAPAAAGAVAVPTPPRPLSSHAESRPGPADAPSAFRIAS